MKTLIKAKCLFAIIITLMLILSALTSTFTLIQKSNSTQKSSLDENTNILKYSLDKKLDSASPTLPLQPDWVNLTVDSAGNVGRYPSIAVDHADGLHISYLDETNNKLKYAYKPNGGAWTNYTIATAYEAETSIAIDSANGVHISYWDDELKYAYKPRGGSWITSTVDSYLPTGFVGWYSSIAIDSANDTHISYSADTDGDLKYAYRQQGGTWTKYTIDSVGDVGLYNSIAIDSARGVHISYYDNTNKNLKYAYKQWGGSWTNYTIDSVGDVGAFSSIAVDSKDGVHISYFENIDLWNGSLKYAYKPKGGVWTNLTVERGIGGTVGWEPAIAIDNNDGVHISYYDGKNGALKYAYKPTGGSWSNYTVDSNGDVGGWSDIAINASNGVHIAYTDETNWDLKYAKKAVGILTRIVVSPSNITLPVGATQRFTAQAYDQWNNSISGLAFNWSVNGGIGTIEQPFTPNIRVNDIIGRDPGVPSIAVDNKNKIHVVWGMNESGSDWNYHAYYANSNDGGQTFSPSVRVSELKFGEAAFRRIAIGSDGKIHVVWRGNLTGSEDQNIYYANSTDGGLTFSSSVQVNDDTATPRLDLHDYPDIAIDSNNKIHVVWVDYRDWWTKSILNIYYANSTDGGYTFNKNVKVNDANLVTGSTPVSIAIGNDNKIHVVWTDRRNGNSDIFYANSTNGGLSFNKNIKVNDDIGGTAQFHPKIVVDNNLKIHVVWSDDRNGERNIYYANSTNGGISFNKNVKVTDAASLWPYVPDMAVGADNRIHVVWADKRRSGIYEVFYARSSNGGISFTNSIRVNEIVPGATNYNAPSIAVGSNSSRVNVVWHDDRGGSYGIYFASQLLNEVMFNATKPGTGYVNATERGVTGSAIVRVVEPVTVTFNVSTAANGTPLTSSNNISVMYTWLGSVRTAYIWDGHNVTVQVDKGTYVSFSPLSSASNSTFRWTYAQDGVSYPSWLVTGATTLTAKYYHQYKPSVILNGTTSMRTVSIENRTSCGALLLQTGLYNSWSDWCDSGSNLTFSENTTGTPQYRTTSPRSWIVTSAFTSTIYYRGLNQIAVLPSAVSLHIGQAQQFTATGYDNEGNVISISPSWTVNGGGTVTNTGFFTATDIGIWTIYANQSGISGNATVTVTPGPLALITVSPSSISLSAGQAQQFTATGYDSYGNVVSVSPTWAVDGGGSITFTGLFTAEIVGTWKIYANQSGISGNATVTVSPSYLVRIEIVPSAVTINADMRQQFTATGYDSYGNSLPVSPGWEATNGTITDTGLFTPWKVGTWKVYANQSGISGNATVTVTPGALHHIIVSPSSITLTADQSQEFTAKGYDAKNNDVLFSPTWTATNGTISTTGVYTPWTVGTWKVYANQSGISGNATVIVSAGALKKIVVSPSFATITADQTQQFTATGYDAKNNIVSITPSWSATGGTISTTGIYTPDRTGTFTIYANQSESSGEAKVLVLAGKPNYIVITPNRITITRGDKALFSAACYDAKGNVVQGLNFTWNITGGIGKVDPTLGMNTTFTATSGGSGKVTATNGTITGYADVTVTLPPPPTITLISPNGGEIWKVGTYHPITWNATGGDQALVIKLEYSVSGVTGSYLTIADNITNTTTYLWRIPNTPSTNCYVKATVTDGAGQSGTDVSDKAFTITVPLGSISGKITDKNGKPLDDAMVSIYHTNGTKAGYTTSDRNGNYTLSNLLPGIYNITVNKTGYKSAFRNVTLGLGETKNDINFVLTEEKTHPPPRKDSTFLIIAILLLILFCVFAIVLRQKVKQRSKKKFVKKRVISQKRKK